MWLAKRIIRGAIVGITISVFVVFLLPFVSKDAVTGAPVLSILDENGIVVGHAYSNPGYLAVNIGYLQDMPRNPSGQMALEDWMRQPRPDWTAAHTSRLGLPFPWLMHIEFMDQGPPIRRSGWMWRIDAMNLTASIAAIAVLSETVLLVLMLARRRLRRTRGCCMFCAYDLRGSPSGSCPECGSSQRSIWKEQGVSESMPA